MSKVIAWVVMTTGVLLSVLLSLGEKEREKCHFALILRRHNNCDFVASVHTINGLPTETLLCDDPKSPDNTVQTIEGDPLHLYSEVKVTCLPGMHFTGQPLNVTMVTVKCLPLPHPCMCMAAWETQDDFMLMYDFNCTSGQTFHLLIARL